MVPFNDPWFIRKDPPKEERMSPEKGPFQKETSSSKHQVSCLEDPKYSSPLKIQLWSPPKKIGSHFWFEPLATKNSSIPSHSASSSPPFDRCVLVQPLGSSWRPPRPKASSSSSRHRWALRPQCLRWWVGGGLGDLLSHEKKSRGALLSIEQGEITLGKSHLEGHL